MGKYKGVPKSRDTFPLRKDITVASLKGCGNKCCKMFATVREQI